MTKEWFETWFDSPYYDILYSHRDEDEARLLINNMMEMISIPSGASVLDVGCGNGRHASYLAKKGFKVTGVDISEYSINQALKQSGDIAEFFVHDMREPFPGGPYKLLLNLFTSFGYFVTEQELKQTLDNFYNSLENGGFLVLDYFNAYRTLQNLVPAETIEKKGIQFNIQRYQKGNFLVKEIEIGDQNGDVEKHFERVRLLNISDFEEYLENTGFRIRFLCGNYDMTPFNAETSPRLIIIACKEGN